MAVSTSDKHPPQPPLIASGDQMTLTAPYGTYWATHVWRTSGRNVSNIWKIVAVALQWNYCTSDIGMSSLQIRGRHRNRQSLPSEKAGNDWLGLFFRNIWKVSAEPIWRKHGFGMVNANPLFVLYCLQFFCSEISGAPVFGRNRKKQAIRSETLDKMSTSIYTVLPKPACKNLLLSFPMLLRLGYIAAWCIWQGSHSFEPHSLQKL